MKTSIFCIYLLGILVPSSELISQNFELVSNNRLILGSYQERSASVVAGDIDGDGDNNILVANGRHWPGQNRMFINNGSGIFTVEKNLGEFRSTSYAAELGDFDNDGDLDLAVGNDMAPNNLFFNDGF